MHDLIRCSALSGYCDLVARLGGDSEKLLRRFHWTPRTLDQPDAVISYRSVIRLLELTATQLQCPDFGMQLAGEQGIHILGPLAKIALHSETVGHALRSIIQQLDYYSPACVARLNAIDADTAILTFDAAVAGEPRRRQTMELAIGVSHRDLQFLSEGHFVPRAVLFRHSQLAPRSAYRARFQVTPRFEQAVNGIILSTADLQRPMKANDPYLRRIVVEYVQHATSTRPLDVVPQVEFLLRQFLSDSLCTLRVVAQHLSIHERTLQRRLEAQGTSFEALLDKVRCDVAKSMLIESDLSMAQVASRLGYSDQSAFSHACRRWFGRTPRMVRMDAVRRRRTVTPATKAS